MIQGKSNIQLAKQVQISFSSAHTWKKKFIEQMQLLELYELVYWLTWQCSRGRAYTNKLIKQQHKKNNKKVPPLNSR
ncbi:hypothetical protein MTZ49_07440 [Entomomonas sp. E2T0]|uniref:hypothetical protein n=1 Tax=Entomomonas sp. E2T0 TaxID=2930213 RepID=UPI002228461F|nr:hypothetical protein [Entomomonas sp. E2T0]UYZ85371.1 hypothetical protein MTZ49_07440 [Entomomonas sp. E2T0]